MLNDDTKNKIKDIINGTHITWQTDTCTATRNYLCRSFTASATVKKDFDSRLLIKKEQAQDLIKFIDQNDLWMPQPPQADQLLTIGGEAEIYMKKNTKIEYRSKGDRV